MSQSSDETDFLLGVTTYTETADPWTAAAGQIVTLSFHIPTYLIIVYYSVLW